MTFCTNCGANVPDDIKFCTACGKPMDAAPAQAATPAAPAAAPANTAPPQPVFQRGADAPPPKGGKYAVIGTGGYIGMMILFAIPIVGWLTCIIMAFAAGNRNRRSFARATLVFLLIGLVFAVAFYFVFSWVWETVQEYIRQYISEATGGQITDFAGLGNLFDIFKGLDGLDIPALPGQ